MNALSALQDGFNRWIDSVAGTANATLDRFRSERVVRVIEEDDGAFTLRLERDVDKSDAKYRPIPDYRFRVVGDAVESSLPPDWTTILRGSRAELVLRSRWFLFRPLELPKRAIEFLDGIIRAQIDRLTPWTANEAAFGWTLPTDAANDRIELTIAATARTLVAPLAQIVADLGVASVVVLTVPDGMPLQTKPIRIFEQRGRGMLELDRIRRFLVTLFVLTGLLAAMSIAYSGIAADNFDTEQLELSRKIAERRAALRAGPEFATSARHMLERRKQTTPSSVIVLEALSQILPDQTYVTELRIEGSKLQIVGISSDASALIALIERSAHFTNATFYAPTTRTPGEPGERFHIEARIKAIFAMST